MLARYTLQARLLGLLRVEEDSNWFVVRTCTPAIGFLFSETRKPERLAD